MAHEQVADTSATLELAFGSDSLSADERDGHFNITIDNPWAGDTISGFGAETHIALDREGAKKLADWLYTRLGHTS